MVSGNSPDDVPNVQPRREGSGWSRLVTGMAKQFFGESPPSQADSEEASSMQDTPPTGRASSAAEAVFALERTLEQFETVLGALEQRTRSRQATPGDVADVGHAQREVIQRFEEALAQLGAEASRLSEGAAQLAGVAARLEGQVGSIAASFQQLEPVAQEPPVPGEPRFEPDGRPVGIVLTAVPGFQGLMDAQRALSTMPAAEGASVVGYKNGEAAIEVVLRAPVSARQIVDGLRASTGHQLLIEEARPEELRLRLRFID